MRDNADGNFKDNFSIQMARACCASAGAGFIFSSILPFIALSLAMAKMFRGQLSLPTVASHVIESYVITYAKFSAALVVLKNSIIFYSLMLSFNLFFYNHLFSMSASKVHVLLAYSKMDMRERTCFSFLSRGILISLQI